MKHKLRSYQEEAVQGVMKGFEANRSLLVVMATGLGKSVLFSEIASRFIERGKVLCLAHRKELVEQAAEHLIRATGEQVDIEQAENWGSIRARIVSASVQTLTQQKRLERFAPDHFSLVIADEAHHYTSESFRKILDYFTGAKILGVTATPDRADEKAMGKVFDDVAYVMDIVDGIEQGYLVPITGQSIRVDSIDLSGVTTSQGDLAVGELDLAMSEGVEGVVAKTLELAGDRQGVWFWPGVKSAELAYDRLTALGVTCGFVSGETDKEERREILRQYKAGNIRHLVNCAVFTEGFDAPATSLVVMARPTKSRMLYAQCAGRGTRVLPGVVEHVWGKEGATERRQLIASSAKPNLLLLDFYGNSGKHTLCTPEDLLGGDYSDEEVAEAKKKAKEMPGQDVLANLEATRKQLKAMMAKMQSKVTAQVQAFNPFSVLGMKAPEHNQERFREPMTPYQQKRLEEHHNIKPKQMEGLSKVEAQKLLGTLEMRRKLGLCSLNQLNTLKKYCEPPTNLTFRKASAAMKYLAEEARWNPDRQRLQAMVSK